MADLNEQLVERKKIIDEMRAMNEKAIKENRDFDATEKDKYEKLEAAQASIKARVDRAMQLDQAAKDNEHKPEGVRAGVDAQGKTLSPRETPEYRSAFVAWAKHGDAGTPLQIKAVLEKAVNSQGGYLVPIEFETKIVQKMYNANIMRQLGTVIRTTSQVNIPMEGNLPTFGWIDELGTFPTTNPTVGQAVLKAWKLGGIITVSEELMDDAFIDIGDYIAGRSALAAGFAEESAYIGGDGTLKPTGWLTTIAGSGTNGAVTSSAPTTVLSGDLINLYYSVPRAYRKNGSFIVADSAIKSLRSEKATTGQYLWAPSLTAGAPDTFLAKPIFTSDYLTAVAAGTVSAAFGDFSYYQIVDRVGWSMQRLNELYAATGQIGFRMWERTDGILIRPEAVNVLTQHA